MTSNQKKKIIRGLTIVFLLVFTYIIYASWVDVRKVIKLILSSSLTVALVAIYVSVSVIAHQLFVEGGITKSGLIFSHFGKFADPILAAGTFIVATNTSLALLNGFFSQVAYGQGFCVSFGTLDVYSILIVSAFLLYYCLLASTRLYMQVFSQVDAIEVKR